MKNEYSIRNIPMVMGDSNMSRRFVKQFSTYDGHPEQLDEMINKWVLKNSNTLGFNLIDVKYRVHYNDDMWYDIALVIYESDEAPYVNWDKGEKQ